MFFVLSTGRSGSETAARVLSQAPNGVCRHEPHPQLLAECTGYRYGRLRLTQLAALLRASRPRDRAGIVYGESNNRLSQVLPVLRGAFPDAQYAWLVRDGRDFVCSALQRGWFDRSRPGYVSDQLERTRLRGDLVGDVAPGEWERWRPFHKACWTWSYVNRLIGAEIEGLGAHAYGPVRLEELDEHLDDLADFLGLVPPPRWNLTRWNARVEEASLGGAAGDPLNRVPRIVRWREWTTDQRGVFERLCGDLMDQLYDGWRASPGWSPTRSFSLTK